MFPQYYMHSYMFISMFKSLTTRLSAVKGLKKIAIHRGDIDLTREYLMNLLLSKYERSHFFYYIISISILSGFTGTFTIK